MPNSYQYSQKGTDLPCLIIRFMGGLLCGGLLGVCVYWGTELKGVWLFIFTGALIGGLISLFWQTLATLWMRFRSEDWRVTEIEIETLGQKWKLANSGTQKRVAWSIFVEIVTRIATQSMSDTDGDNGIALKSLYDLFQYTRKSIAEIKPASMLPSRKKSFDTVETYALAMLNQDLRPFLSKWHPIWDAWRKANPDADSFSWDRHMAFRNDLKFLQNQIRGRAEGLGKIAGVSEISRFMNEPVYLKSNDQD
jgi:hypothetical protein